MFELMVNSFRDYAGPIAIQATRLAYSPHCESAQGRLPPRASWPKLTAPGLPPEMDHLKVRKMARRTR